MPRKPRIVCLVWVPRSRWRHYFPFPSLLPRLGVSRPRSFTCHYQRENACDLTKTRGGSAASSPALTNPHDSSSSAKRSRRRLIHPLLLNSRPCYHQPCRGTGMQPISISPPAPSVGDQRLCHAGLDVAERRFTELSLIVDSPPESFLLGLFRHFRSALPYRRANSCRARRTHAASRSSSVLFFVVAACAILRLSAG